jgi:hypothetical protein
MKTHIAVLAALTAFALPGMSFAQQSGQMNQATPKYQGSVSIAANDGDSDDRGQMTTYSSSSRASDPAALRRSLYAHH